MCGNFWQGNILRMSTWGHWCVEMERRIKYCLLKNDKLTFTNFGLDVTEIWKPSSQIIVGNELMQNTLKKRLTRPMYIVPLTTGNHLLWFSLLVSWQDIPMGNNVYSYTVITTTAGSIRLWHVSPMDLRSKNFYYHPLQQKVKFGVNCMPSMMA